MSNDKASGEWEIFAGGFTGVEVITQPDQARCRPMGKASFEMYPSAYR